MLALLQTQSYTLSLEMCNVDPIGDAGLSSKEKAIKQYRGRNIHSIVTKLGTNIGLMKLHFEFGDVLWGTRRGRTFLERNFP